jgi:hypothetical protein
LAVGQELLAPRVRAGRYDIVVVIAWMQKTCAVDVATRERMSEIEAFMIFVVCFGSGLEYSSNRVQKG